MTRKKRDHTAEVVIRFPVPKGATPSQCRRFIWNNMTGNTTMYPDYIEAETFGDAIIKATANRATVMKPGQKPPNVKAMQRAIDRVWASFDHDDQEQADAVANLPTALNSALADILRLATQYS